MKGAVLTALAVLMSALPVYADTAAVLPLRSTFEGLGYEVSWDAETKTASVGDIVKITSGEKMYYINGEQRDMETPAYIADGKMYVPSSLADEIEALQVEWIDGETAECITPGSDELLRDYLGETLSAQIVYNLVYAVGENPERTNIYADKVTEFIKSGDTFFTEEQKQEFVSVIEGYGGDKDKLIDRCSEFFDKISARSSDEKLDRIEQAVKKDESFAASVDAIWEEEYFKADERFADVEFFNDTANYTQISGIYADLFGTMQKRIEALPADTKDRENIKGIYASGYGFMSDYYGCINKFDADNDVKMILMP